MSSNWSPLDEHVDTIKELLVQGLTPSQIADRLIAAGVLTTRNSVNRAVQRHGLGKAKTSGVQSVLVERLARAQRASEDAQTAEDKLTDALESSRDQLRIALQTINRLRDRQTLEDRIGSIIEEALSDYEFAPILRSSLPVDPSDTEALLLFSDTHYGEQVDPAQALGIDYNPEIARHRIEQLRDAVLELRGGLSGKLVIASLGDQLSGSIHPELEVHNALHMVDQARDMAHIMFEMAVSLTSEIERVELVVIPGNHPRVHQKPRYKGRFENWETVMGEMIAGFTKYAQPDGLIVSVPRAYPYVHEVASKRIGMIHGDGIKSASFAGIPFYGMRQQREAVQALMSTVGQDRIDMFVMGHWHQHLEWPGECDIVVNGSVKGADEYSIGTRLAANPPEQVLLEIDPLQPIGSVTKHRIYLGDVT